MKFNYIVFSTENNKYFFDGMSCNIFSINNEIYNNHKHLFENISNKTFPSDDLFKNEYKLISEVIANGILMENSITKVMYWYDINKYKSELNNKINHLMIELTDKCNFRCKYCIYSNHYYNERKHGDTSINESAIKKAIEFFFANSKGADKKVINFYGGEPFIEFRKMKKTVEIINNYDKEIKYFITTNALLLSNDIAKWFIKNNNVHLFISLAGIPNRHDELRVLLNGEPTYELIKKNLLNIKKMNENVYAERVNFVFNIFDEIQLEEVNNFWFTDELFQNAINLPEITCIDCIEDDGTIRKLANKVLSNYLKNKKPLDLYISYLKNRDYNNIIVKYFDKKYLSFHRRSINDDSIVLSAVCKPFINKIFIDVNGHVNICENFTFGGKFGNISDNLKINVLDELLSEYKNYRKDNCEKCWALKICSLCFKDLFDNNGNANTERARYLCSKEKSTKKQQLIEYCTILEEDETLLDHLFDYK